MPNDWLVRNSTNLFRPVNCIACNWVLLQQRVSETGSHAHAAAAADCRFCCCRTIYVFLSRKWTEEEYWLFSIEWKWYVWDEFLRPGAASFTHHACYSMVTRNPNMTDSSPGRAVGFRHVIWLGNNFTHFCSGQLSIQRDGKWIPVSAGGSNPVLASEVPTHMYCNVDLTLWMLNLTCMYCLLYLYQVNIDRLPVSLHRLWLVPQTVSKPQYLCFSDFAPSADSDHIQSLVANVNSSIDQSNLTG